MSRTHTDRRTDTDRRKGFDLAVIDKLGIERREKERRELPEQRDGWIRVSDWSSFKVA